MVEVDLDLLSGSFAQQVAAPVRCGVEVTSLKFRANGSGYRAETSHGSIGAWNVVAAAGPFQRPIIPPLVPDTAGLMQIHSAHYRNPAQLPAGAVLVIGAGSSGVQIADELLRAGRRVTLVVVLHNRPPRRYRGRDYCCWLGGLGKWDVKTRGPGTEHVTLAVSGAHGGHTVDFRGLAARGMILVGRAESYRDGVLRLAPDLADNIAKGDADYLSVLDEADALRERSARREGQSRPPRRRFTHPRPLHIGPSVAHKPLLLIHLGRVAGC